MMSPEKKEQRRIERLERKRIEKIELDRQFEAMMEKRLNRPPVKPPVDSSRRKTLPYNGWDTGYYTGEISPIRCEDEERPFKQ
jgi:hypothetical protein